MPGWLKKLLIERGLATEESTDEELQKLLEEHPGLKRSAGSDDGDDAGDAGDAEDGAGDGSSAGDSDPPKPPKKTVKRTAAEDEDEEEETDDDAEPTVERSARAEVVKILEFCRNARVPTAKAEEWVRDDWTLEQVRTAVVDDLIRSRPPMAPRFEFGTDASDKFFGAHRAALMRRANAENERITLKDVPEQVGRDIPVDLPLAEHIRRFLKRDHVRGVENWTLDQLAGKGLQIIARAMQHSTSDFPYLLENVAQKSLVAGFQEAETTWQKWCGTVSVRDFKTVSRAKLSEAEDFLVNPELSPIVESTLGEGRETYSIQTYARRFGISRQAIINDDLSAFTRVPGLFGDAAARTMNKKVYATFLAQPTMAEDGKVLFASDHPSGTNIGSGGVISATTLAEARKLMRLQKGFNPKGGAYLNLTPAFLLAPATIENTVLQMLQGGFFPTAATGVQPTWMSQLTPIIDPCLDADSVAEWYLACKPSTIDTVVGIFLNGVRTPQILRLDGTAILGIEWIAHFDFGAKVLEHRGLFYNAGAGG